MAEDTDRRLSGFFERTRASGRQPTAIQAGMAAREAGLSFVDFARLASSLVMLGRHDAPTAPAAVEVDGFIAGLAADPSCRSILEIVDQGEIRCAAAVAARPGITVTLATRSADIADAIEAYGTPAAMKVWTGLGDLDRSLRYDLIVACPPWGHRPKSDKGADGFEGEVVRDLLPMLAKGGRLVWITTRAVRNNPRVAKNRDEWKGRGHLVRASIDLPGGWMTPSPVEGVALVLAAGAPGPKLLGVLREVGSGAAAAAALLAGRGKKPIAAGLWVDADDGRSYGDVEHAASINKQMPRGVPRIPLKNLVPDEPWVKADRPPTDRAGIGYLYLPEYATSTVTARLEDQTVAHSAVWRVPIHTSKANPAFLARVMNSPLGKTIRQGAAGGATIPRIIRASLLDAPVPLPDLQTQDRIVRLHADMAAVSATVADRLASLDQDWKALDEVAHEVEALKGVFDLDRRIDGWWSELPYPLATIHRRHRVTTDPKERFDTLLHFFEVFAVYLASMGVSHLRALRKDAAEPLEKLFHPERGAPIERADFGFWAALAAGSFKEMRRTLGDEALRAVAFVSGGPSVVTAVEAILPLWDATRLLERPREMRNTLRGHGGLMKPVDAEKANKELETVLRDLFAATAGGLRKAKLVRVGQCQILDDRNVYETEVLEGSHTTFDRRSVQSQRRVNSRSLAFWHPDGEEIIGGAPFFRLGASHEPAESTMYVYNRVEADGLRWVSYQEAKDQAITLPDDGLSGLIRPRS